MLNISIQENGRPMIDTVNMLTLLTDSMKEIVLHLDASNITYCVGACEAVHFLIGEIVESLSDKES